MPKNLVGSGYFESLKQAGWKMRHLAVLALAVLAVYGFWIARADWSDMHRWNRAFGDASLVLVAIAMAIGPVAKLWLVTRVLIPWRREFGIWGIVLAAIHTAIILFGWVDWDFARLFGYEFHPQLDRYVMIQHGFGLANIIGIVALFYGLVLASTSNNLSQRFLGGPVWKFFQQSAYVLWALIVIHTAYFLFLHFLHFHQPVPEPNWARWPFVALVAVVLALQALASWKTWRGNQKSRRRQEGRTIPTEA